MQDAASTAALLLSLRVSVAATTMVVLVGAPTALWLARRPSLLPRLVELLLSLPLVIPPVATGYVLLVVLGPGAPVGRWLARMGLRFALDWKGAALASGLVSFPLFLAVARAAFAACDERVEAAARTLGAGPPRVLFTITLPQAWRGLAGGAALSFARAFGEFGAAMMLAGNIPGETRTVPQAIFTNLLTGRNAAAGRLVLVSVAVGVVAMVLAQRLAWPGVLGAGRGEPGHA